jgi:hypothetical protein
VSRDWRSNCAERGSQRVGGSGRLRGSSRSNFSCENTADLHCGHRSRAASWYCSADLFFWVATRPMTPPRPYAVAAPTAFENASGWTGANHSLPHREQVRFHSANRSARSEALTLHHGPAGDHVVDVPKQRI